MLNVIETGVNVADSVSISEQDAIWCQYSTDKADIAQRMATIVQDLATQFPSEPMRALSVGCNVEPQIELFESGFTDGVWLMDIDPAPLKILDAQLDSGSRVELLEADYRSVFLDDEKTSQFLADVLEGQKLHFVAFHHSLYYSTQSEWDTILRNVRRVMVPGGAMHLVLMASRSEDPATTTWIYNHFADRFCGHHNDQDLRQLADQFSVSELETHRIEFWSDEFSDLMSVIWMIMLYPMVHQFDTEQKTAITRYVFETLFEKGRPLIQEQDHLVVWV